MGSSTQHLFPYDSLDKYSETIIQCPICHYYLKINPQTDTMKYRSLSQSQIQFLTFHQFNSSVHSIVLEYDHFSFSQIVDFSDHSDSSDSSDLFPLFHLVNLSEYQSFRDRILELESNNNDLISSFKTKLDGLESSYKQTELDNSSLKQQVIDLDDLRVDFELALSDKLVELDSFKRSQSDQSDLVSEIKSLQDELASVQQKRLVLEQAQASFDREKTELQLQISSLTQKVEQLEKSQDTRPDPKPVDEKLLSLLEQERKQKRVAVREKKSIESQVSQLEESIQNLEQKYSHEQELKEKVIQQLKDLREQSEHTLTLNYEKKISDLTLVLQDREDQIKLLQQNSDQTPKRSSSKFDKTYREQIASLFLQLQKKFNSFQYDILLSFYDTAQLDNQIRHAFEQFFSQLIQKANAIGQSLLDDPSFSLFHDIREINPRLKFTPDQQTASLQLQALDIVFTDLLVYVFAIIKSMKAQVEDDNYVLVPDDADISILINSEIHDRKIFFHIPRTEETNFDSLGPEIRVFRPTSELYKHSFIFITKKNDSTLSNNTYQLLPFEFHQTDTDYIITVDNFFMKTDSFKLGSFYYGQFFIIQKNGLDQQFNFFRDFALKNKI